MHKVILNDVIDIISGGTPKTDIERYWNGEIGWLSVVDFNNDNRWVYCSEKCITLEGMNNSSTKLLNLGDIIISARGTVGALAQIGKPMCFNQSCFGLRGKQGIITNDYLYYALKNYIANMRMCAQGSVFETINLLSFKLMDITIHDKIEEQSKISYILGLLDNKIELNNKINTELEEIAKDLYDYWFIQFDFPDKDKRPYKSSGGKMVYNDVLKREIPEGWVALFLDQRLSFERGFECGKEEYTEKTDGSDNFIKYYRVGDMDDSGNTFISKHLHDIKLLSPYDLVVSFDGSIGRISFGLCGAYSSGIRKIKDKQQIIDNGVLLFIMASECIQQTIKKYATGSNILHASASIPHLTIAYNEDVLARYQSIIKSIYQQMVAIKLENKRLGELRDFLLPMLMNGQVSVSD